jgi:hypothetical protein
MKTISSIYPSKISPEKENFLESPVYDERISAIGITNIGVGG